MPLEWIVTVKCEGTPGDPEVFRVEADTTLEALRDAAAACEAVQLDHLRADDFDDDEDFLLDDDWDDDGD